MGTPVTNFGKVTVSTGYDASATSIVLSTGHGSRLPSTFPYPLTWWNATDYSDAADDPNREIVQVTARAGDTLTIVRGHESTTASVKNVAGKTYKLLLGITKAMWDDLFTNSLSQSVRGLSLQTHPNNDVADHQVYLAHADAIVMQDGQEIQDWNNLNAGVTGVGPGGLDTGSEQASTWYEIYAIYNGTTKSLLLHRAKNFAAGAGYSSGDDGNHPLRDATARTKLSQGFQTTIAGPAVFIDVKLHKTGTPTGNYWFTIESDSGGVPSGTVLATSDKYGAARLSTTNGWIRISFRTPASLSAATQYHLVFQGDFTVSASNHINWRADTTAATYANGSKSEYNGTTWTNDTDDDFMFSIWQTVNDTAVTMPSGYTQRALIGYVYNDASSNLKRFRAINRAVSCGFAAQWNLGAITATAPTAVDLAAFLPPIPVIAEFSCETTTSIHIGVGHISATDCVPPNEAIDGVAYVTSGTGTQINPLGPIALEQQAMFAVVNGSSVTLRLAGFEW